MRVLLQNFETGLYLACDSTWTNTPDKGMRFPDELSASEYKRAQRLFKVFAVVLPENRKKLSAPRGHHRLGAAWKRPVVGAPAPGQTART